MNAERSIHLPLGDLVALAQEAIIKPATPPRDLDVRLDAITGELVAICTAKPSRKAFVDCAKILCICLRRLLLARQCMQAEKITSFESGVGHFLPYVKVEAYEAMVWEREQAAP